MQDNLYCSFCEQLPTLTHPGRCRRSKCPLCRQEIWTAPNGGTYRLDANGAAPRSRARLLAGVGAGLAIGVCVVGAIVGLANRNTAPSTPFAAEEPTLIVAPRKTPVVALAAPARPDVQAKPGAAGTAPSVKPGTLSDAPSPIAEARSAVKPAPRTDFYEPPTVKPSKVFPGFAVLSLTDDQLELLLRDVPEIDLDLDYAKKTKTDIAKFAAKITEDTKGDHDQFIHQLKKSRPELSGLPFLLGKDCQLKNEDAGALAVHSLGIRRAMSMASPVRSRNSPSHGGHAVGELFWQEYASFHARSREIKSDNLPALKQIVMAESPEIRMGLVSYLNKTNGERSTALLAHIAIFDLNANVRAFAANVLRGRDKKEYVPILVKGLRYPWAPMARRAADALTHLYVKEAVPELAAMLDEPDPAAPFVVKIGFEKPKTMIRELVRVNHHRNCLLCHAPNTSSTSDGRPTGPVTSMQDALPSLSTVEYYSPRRGITLVRADITYLRQDFSVMQHVVDSKEWPISQRFDFLIRTREISESDALAMKKAPGAVSDHQEEILRVLRALTGQDFPANSSAWLEAIRKP